MFPSGNQQPENQPSGFSDRKRSAGLGTQHSMGVRKPLPSASTIAGCVASITESGSYYLDRQVLGAVGKHGIIIAASHVTLDLNGYDVCGVPGSSTGIVVLAETGVVIRGGSVHGWGAHGIDAERCAAALVECIRTSDNIGDGLRIGPGGSADAVRASENGGNGLTLSAGSTLHDCAAVACGGIGIDASENCRVIDSAASAGARDGIRVGSGGVVRACLTRHNLGAGIVASRLCTVSECDSVHNDSDGICVNDECCVLRSRSHGSRNGAGVRAIGQGNRIDENTCAENRIGIVAQAPGNIITRNAISASAESAMDIACGNRAGRLLANPEYVKSEITWSNFVM
ncbi:MAG: right-handed parallel beta-helix repeat-containing protein [Pyrinomonadaceae bacterium]|nr:right-handed parallel beta-helix repeat-containing protein [Phycisphaerales bacterium]